MKVRGFERIKEDLLPKGADGKVIIPTLPMKSTYKSGAYDFFTVSKGVVMPNQTVIMRTGIKAYMLDDDVLSIFTRSGMGVKTNIVLANGTGIIDADYYGNPDNDGEILVALFNEGTKPYVVKCGDRIAQGIFSKSLPADEGTYIMPSKKRMSGFGSTGV